MRNILRRIENVEARSQSMEKEIIDRKPKFQEIQRWTNASRLGMPPTLLAARPNVQPVDTSVAFTKQQGKRPTNTAESNALSPAWGGVETPQGWPFVYCHYPPRKLQQFRLFSSGSDRDRPYKAFLLSSGCLPLRTITQESRCEEGSIS